MTGGNGLLRVGVAGVGSLGFHHARILSSLPGVRMEGVYDLRRERAREVAETLSLVAHDTLENLLDGVDAVVVAVSTADHERVALEAIRRGVHVFVEKPIAHSLEAADRVVDEAHGRGVMIQVGHVERFNAAVLEAEPYLDRPLFIESHRLASFTPRGTDVAVVLDLMIHDVDLVQTLVGSEVVEIAATGVPVLTPSVDIANARLSFAGGAVANLTASRVSTERMRKIRIFQRSGYLSLDLARGTGEFLRLKRDLPALSGGAGEPEALAALVAGGGGLDQLVDRISFHGSDEEPLRRELESFRDAALGDRTPLVSGEDGRDALRVALAIEERIRSHVAHTRST